MVYGLLWYLSLVFFLFNTAVELLEFLGQNPTNFCYRLRLDHLIVLAMDIVDFNFPVTIWPPMFGGYQPSTILCFLCHCSK